jgi:hypothetical protein
MISTLAVTRLRSLFFYRSLALFFFLAYSSLSNAQNYALSFDGTNDRVTVPHNIAYNLGTGDFTLEAVVNLTDKIILKEPIISKRTTGTDGFVFMIFGYGNYLLLQTGGVGNEVSGFFPNILDGNCHHIAVVRTGGNTTTFYVDGIQRGQNVLAHLGINSLGALHFGYDVYDVNFLDGSISEIRFWNKGRTQFEIQTFLNVPIPNNSTGLIGLWRFNEGVGDVVADSSATKNDGYLGNSPVADIQDPARNGKCPIGDVILGVQNSTLSNSVTLHPNPFIDHTTLRFNNKVLGPAQVQVYTMQGHLVLSHYLDGESHEFVFGQDLPKGVYLVNVIEDNAFQSYKIVKD